ncbi:hypothetical protein OFO07_03500 [Campylobacter sp. JMF_06 NA1]|uniref:hypothetical protein n=1 Tax=Campylobacter sp. JMF_06 NA1 TaxID=2983823 RepID=UPI0022E9BCEE|nr:hypothetical protein [Campylobacter sp. JMF_06 NA1]MDA3077990.1 hypothetical protein [Campylobacter sp. JMF_06 NA1]
MSGWALLLLFIGDLLCLFFIENVIKNKFLNIILYLLSIIISIIFFANLFFNSDFSVVLKIIIAIVCLFLIFFSTIGKIFLPIPEKFLDDEEKCMKIHIKNSKKMLEIYKILTDEKDIDMCCSKQYYHFSYKFDLLSDAEKEIAQYLFMNTHSLGGDYFGSSMQVSKDPSPMYISYDERWRFAYSPLFNGHDLDKIVSKKMFYQKYLTLLSYLENFLDNMLIKLRNLSLH